VPEHKGAVKVGYTVRTAEEQAVDRHTDAAQHLLAGNLLPDDLPRTESVDSERRERTGSGAQAALLPLRLCPLDMVLSGITITLLARRWVTGCCTRPFAK